MSFFPCVCNITYQSKLENYCIYNVSNTFQSPAFPTARSCSLMYNINLPTPPENITKIKCRPGTRSLIITHHGRQAGVVEDNLHVSIWRTKQVRVISCCMTMSLKTYSSSYKPHNAMTSATRRPAVGWRIISQPGSAPIALLSYTSRNSDFTNRRVLAA